MQDDEKPIKRRKIETTKQDVDLEKRELQQELNQKLIDALEKDDITAVKAMCDITTCQPPMNLNLPTKRNEFVLHKAAKKGNLAIVHLLINAGANLEIKDLFCNQTALHIAASNGDVVLIRLFLAHNANINALDAQGETPLHKAVHYAHTDVVQLLINHKANPFICSKPLIFYPIPLATQQTPRDIALQQILKIDDMITNNVVSYEIHDDEFDEISSKTIYQIDDKLLDQHKEYCRIRALLESYEKTIKNH
jgi:ankyrin repeat protein